MSLLVIAPTQEEEVDSSLQSNAKVENTKDEIEKQMAEELLTKLNEQSDLVIDFSCLKKCLNPIAIEDAQSQEQELDYEELVCDLIEKHAEKLPNLDKLTIRRLLQSSSTDIENERYDRYSQVNHGIMQMSCLSQLDLCELPEIFHDQLQLWNLHNLKKLSITSSKLKSFPGSVGRLKNLQELDLSSNHLSNLPITLAFCKDLKTLDLHSNQFRQLPGVIQRLDKLTTLRRLNNPLTPRYTCSGPRYTRKITKSQVKDEKRVYQPITLQASCTTVIFTSQVDYWGTMVIGPLQCKTMDRLASQFTVCDNCNRMLPATEKGNTLGVEVLLVTFAELSGVPFLFHACNESCQTKLMEMYGQKNIDLQEKIDTDYEESIKQALREAGEEPLPQQIKHHNRRHHRYHNRRKRCSIM